MNIIKKIAFAGAASAAMFGSLASGAMAVDRVPGPVVLGPWDVTNSYVVDFKLDGDPVNTYSHDASLTQTGSSVTGNGGYPAGGPHIYEWSITSGSVTGDTLSFTADYTLGADALVPLTTMHVTGTIAPDGSISGTWDDNYQGGTRTGTWETSSGVATRSQSQFTGTHGQWVSASENKKEAAQSRVGMPVQSKGHTK